MCSFGFNTYTLRNWAVEVHLMTEREVTRQWCEDPTQPAGAEELAHLLDIRAQLILLRGVPRDYVLSPVDFRALSSVVARAETVVDGTQPGSGLPVTDLQIVRSVREVWARMCQGDFVPDSLVMRAVWFEQLRLQKLRQAGVHTRGQLVAVLDFLRHRTASAVIEPGTAIGVLSSQSLSAPLTQMQLDRFHISGQSCALVGGVDRTKQIFNCSKNIPTPSMDIYLLPGCTLAPVRFVQLVCADSFSGWFVEKEGPDRVLHFELKKHILLPRRIPPRVLARRLVGLLSAHASKLMFSPGAADLLPGLVEYARNSRSNENELGSPETR
jgi:hypothetical protein